MENLKVLLIGQPNVGKSSLLNAIVGPRVTVSNYPGTTVEVTRAKKRINGMEIEFIDTPGIYSIHDRSEEEKVTEKALFEEDAGAAIIVADASSLERSLYITLQILEAGIPTVVALNYVEEAEKKGVKVDAKKLGKVLNIPVIPINPIKKKGISHLLDSLPRVNGGSAVFKVKYDDYVEQAIDQVAAQVKGGLPVRFVAIRALEEEEEDFYGYFKNREAVEDNREKSPGIAKEISVTRYGVASFIAGSVSSITPLPVASEVQEKLDNILLHKVWGPVTSALSLLLIFGSLLYLGNLAQGYLMDATDSLLAALGAVENSIAGMMLVQGLRGLAAGVSIALPYVFLFYLLLGLMEDVGLLPRLVVNAEKVLSKVGLPGRAFIPLALGLGCTAPACRATRVLSCKKEQFRTASLFAFVPCSSRIAIIMGVVGFYGGIGLSLAVFATALISGLVWALAVKRTMHVESEPFLLELPPYRRPLMKNVIAKGWIRMKDFVYLVIPLLIVGGMIYGILDQTGAAEAIVKPFTPLAVWLGLPAVTIIPLVWGFLQKDLTGAMLLSVLGVEISVGLTPLQIYTFGVASTIGIPCIIAWGMLIREFGFRKATLLTVSSIAYGVLIAGLAWRMIAVF